VLRPPSSWRDNPPGSSGGEEAARTRALVHGPAPPHDSEGILCAPRIRRLPSRPGAREGTLDRISPELVLVDPELARVQRALLPEAAEPRRPSELGSNGLVTEPPAVQEAKRLQETPAGKQRRSARGRLAAGLLSLSLLTNGILAGVLVADTRTNQREASFFGPFVTAPEGPTSASTEISLGPTTAPRFARVVAAHRETSATVERKILALVVRSPERLPAALIDRGTGLPENNLQATCRASSDRSFLCVVRPARHKPNEGLQVGYRPGRKGRGLFTWYRYQHG